MRSNFYRIVGLLACTTRLLAQDAAPLPRTAPLTATGDLSVQMVEGIDRWLMRETERVARERALRWQTNFTGTNRSNAQDGARFQLGMILGGLDPRLFSTNFFSSLGDPAPPVAAPTLQYISDSPAGPEVHRIPGANGFVARRVRWPVYEGVFGEGLLLEPMDEKGAVKSNAPCVVAIPDADQEPEMIAGLRPGVASESQFARHLASSGWRVLVPVLASRSDEYSGNSKLERFTNQPHREWIYRQAYELGRTVIGYEVQKVVSGISALQTNNRPVAVAGYGEGGLIALHAAALDTRIGAALVSGYFGPRESLWHEPIYRNLSDFVREFGDAELAALIAPRKLIVEYADAPGVQGPPARRDRRGGAAPGAITTPDFDEVEKEIRRANQLTAKMPGRPFVELVHGSEGATVSFGSRKSLAALSRALAVTNELRFDARDSRSNVVSNAEVATRQERTVREMESLTQHVFQQSEAFRNEVRKQRELMTVATNKSPANEQERLERSRQGRDQEREWFWKSVIGKLDAPKLPPNPRSRKIYDREKWTGYEVMLDVVPDVFAWGYLLVPKDLKPGEKRPVVVCQHGLEGVPEDTVADDPKHKGHPYYKAFAARLAERGFIVYAPHNPYRGQDKFRVLQRKANPVGLSLFSFIIAQHEVTTDWLASLPFVDPQRIAFYGLSYGGKTAMRVPAVVERYCLSICSADFNDWIRKCVTTESPYSYMFTGEYEMPEWNLGHTFNYAEMAGLIAPRPFMVERGHHDGVAPDEWVAYEYARVHRIYEKLGVSDRTEIEFFDGPHTINGVGTFRFLEKHLNWPAPNSKPQ